MKVLFIVPDRYPDLGACSNLLNHLFFQGKLMASMDQISVLAVCAQYNEKQTACCNGITVHYVHLWEAFSQVEYSRLFTKFPVKVLIGEYKKACNKLVRRYCPKLINSSTVRAIRRTLIQLDPQKFDVVVPVMGSVEIAMASLLLKKKNPDIKLVLYQVDPYATNETLPVAIQHQRKELEKELYTSFDRIITTPILLAESSKCYDAAVLEKMVAMEFPNVIAQIEKKRDIENDDINCLFLGNIYGNIRDPRYTIRLFANLDDRIKLKLVGFASDEVKAECRKYGIVHEGPKFLNQAAEELSASDVLVNIGNSMQNQVPSKLFEYISYGKPIVNICKNRNCPTLQYLANYPNVLNLFEEEDLFETQRLQLRDFILQNYQKQISSERIRKEYKTCTPEFCAQQMVRVFKDL